ncbi:hypothetical protein L3K75_14140 [[Ruminococcus] lactaris]|nr:hypothetical protein [[Ruminococcus] lactaris]
MSKIVSLQEWLDEDLQNSAADKRLFLTEEQVRSFPQFKDASALEVQNIIDTLHNLALVSYELFCREAKKDNELNEAA